MQIYVNFRNQLNKTQQLFSWAHVNLLLGQSLQNSKIAQKKTMMYLEVQYNLRKNDNVFESAIQLDMQCGLGCCTIRNKWDTKFDVVPQLINILYNVQHNPTHYKHCTMYNTRRYIRVSFGVHQSHFLSAPSWNTPLTLQTINLILYVFVFLLYLYCIITSSHAW